MTKRLLLAAATVSFSLLSPARGQAQDGGIKVGERAPGAAVETLDGKPVDLAKYLTGKPVVLEFWATWCPLCKQLEAPLEAARSKYAGRVTFVSVGVKDNQTPGRQKAYAESRHLTGEFVFDKDGAAVAAYKSPHTSFLVVVNAEGKVVYTGVGGDQDVDAAIAKAFAMDNMMPRGGN